MKILLTNDDGIYADGIYKLANFLINQGHKITLVAPDRERSAAGHSITIQDPLRVEVIDLSIKGLLSYKVSGTPADCVKLGLERLVKYVPDFIISGINDGPNLGYDVLYSGTVSAAIEAWMMGYNSLAVSLVRTGRKNCNYAVHYIEKLLYTLNKMDNKEPLLLNINIPPLSSGKMKGVKLTKLGTSLYEDIFEERIDPMGRKYYWLTDGGGREEKDINSDIWAVNNNYISITPLKLKLTNMRLFHKLKGFIHDDSKKK
ncbi:MAG TPA: 5'/3'-nucleotidase SurE [Halanaerobiales bacterium]|nr:5'/3'-nucleotidase SurE [Halanaerobiales bacterium]